VRPCECVLRAIFRACYARFRECADAEKRFSAVSLDWTGSGTTGRRTYGRKVEEYLADFCAVSRRALSDEQYAVFRYFYLLGAGWRMTARYLKLDRGRLYHHVYRIQAILGRAFREVEPYGLFPLDEYFSGVTSKRPAPAPTRGTNGRKSAVIAPPLRKIA
jgi:hypothetical protein